jgi:hypothetical protein
LGIIQTINFTVDKKVVELSVGQYFLIAAINRACEATSKNEHGRDRLRQDKR